MEALAGLLTPENTKNFLSMAAQADLTSYLVVVGVVWKVMSRTVSTHFQNIEAAVNRVAGEVADLRKAVTADLAVQSSRLAVLEGSVVELKSRVGKLETK